MSNADVARKIEERMREQGLLPQEPPPFRYFQRRQGKMFCWTIEADTAPIADCKICGGAGEWVGESNDIEPCPSCVVKGWYYGFVYIPVGKGARSGKAQEWKFQESSLRRHRKRRDAKRRAEKLYDGENR